MHLRMTGTLLLDPAQPPPTCACGCCWRHYLPLQRPARFGRPALAGDDQLESFLASRLGIELSTRLRRRVAAYARAGRRGPIKPFLLDQRNVAVSATSTRRGAVSRRYPSLRAAGALRQGSTARKLGDAVREVLRPGSTRRVESTISATSTERAAASRILLVTAARRAVVRMRCPISEDHCRGRGTTCVDTASRFPGVGAVGIDGTSPAHLRACDGDVVHIITAPNGNCDEGMLMLGVSRTMSCTAAGRLESSASRLARRCSRRGPRGSDVHRRVARWC